MRGEDFHEIGGGVAEDADAGVDDDEGDERGGGGIDPNIARAAEKDAEHGGRDREDVVAVVLGQREHGDAAGAAADAPGEERQADFGEEGEEGHPKGDGVGAFELAAADAELVDVVDGVPEDGDAGGDDELRRLPAPRCSLTGGARRDARDRAACRRRP